MSAELLRQGDALPSSVSEHIARVAARALLDELMTWPKPGLVSHVDSGSHTDMNADHFDRSVSAITPFFADLAQAGSALSDMGTLREIGLEAERAMLLATGGINTHRGAIFGLGLLCAAAGLSWLEKPLPHNGWDAAHLCKIVRETWGEAIFDSPVSRATHGGSAQLRYGAGGARAQAGQGFPSVLHIGLPAFRMGRITSPTDLNAARVQAFFSLLAAVEDTNLLHRGGAAGLAFSQQKARNFLLEGGIDQSDWSAQAEQIHAAFVARRLSPGGCADMLAITLFLDNLELDR